MRRLFIVCLTSAIACAGSGPSPGAAPVDQHVIVPGAGSSPFTIAAVSGLSTVELAYPIDRVWKVMPAVFDSVAVPVSLLDPQTHTMGNRGFKLRGKLGKVGLGRYIDCGTTQIGPNAESYDITLTLTTALSTTSGGATAMTIDLEASAKPLAFSQEPFRCSTKGALEQRVKELTAALVNR
jgi:hypothetical protein